MCSLTIARSIWVRGRVGKHDRKMRWCIDQDYPNRVEVLSIWNVRCYSKYSTNFEKWRCSRIRPTVQFQIENQSLWIRVIINKPGMLTIYSHECDLSDPASLDEAGIWLKEIRRSI